MIPSAAPVSSYRTISPALLFVLSCMWIVVSLAGGRLAGALLPGFWYDLSREAFTAVMLFAGFYLMARLGVADLRPLSSVGFVRRPGLAREFGVGAALGWGISLTLMLPAVLSRNVVFGFHKDWLALQQMLLGLAVLCAFVLVVQLVLSGLPVRLLVRSIGPGWMVFAVILVGVCLVLTGGAGQGKGVLFTALALCSSLFAFLRTRAIWLPLGLHLGSMVSLQLILGATSPYTPLTAGLVQNNISGPIWLTGGSFGPEASTVAILILAAGLLVLFRVTKDYAWHYAHQPIISAGYPVDVAPPAAHVQEGRNATASVPLVQIAGLPSHPQEPPPASEPQ